MLRPKRSALGSNRPALAVAAGLALSYLFLAMLGNLNEHIPACLAGYFLAFALYCCAARLAVTHQCRLAAILGFAVLFRLIIFFSPPSLSDDVYRYVWEGGVVARGMNPYALAPAAPELVGLRDDAIFPRINHKELPAIYPPANQLLFGAVALFSQNVYVMKGLFVLFDLAAIAVLLALLRHLQADPRLVIVYAWNPLVVVEFAGSGHLDSAGIFFLLLALYLHASRKNGRAGMVLAVACMCKFIPGLLIPFFMKKRGWRPGLVFLLTVGAFYLPFIDAGWQVLGSLPVYSSHWLFNGSLYAAVLQVAEDQRVARMIVGSLFAAFFAALLLWYWRRGAGDDPRLLCRACFLMLAIVMVLSPVLYPWYLCWIVPLLSLFPSRAWLLLSGTVFFSYWVLKDYSSLGVWREVPLVAFAEYLPFYGLLLYGFMKSSKGGLPKAYA